MKKYTAYLTSTGTVGKVWTKVLENDFDDIEVVRTAVGTYTITTDGGFPLDKTAPKSDFLIDESGNKFKLVHTDENTMTLTTYAAADIDVLADGVLSNRLVNIEVYD